MNGNPLGLLCRLGRHAAVGLPRYKDGYYFASCGRCGAGLVRTMRSGWQPEPGASAKPLPPQPGRSRASSPGPPRDDVSAVRSPSARPAAPSSSARPEPGADSSIQMADVGAGDHRTPSTAPLADGLDDPPPPALDPVSSRADDHEDQAKQETPGSRTSSFAAEGAPMTVPAEAQEIKRLRSSQSPQRRSAIADFMQGEQRPGSDPQPGVSGAVGPSVTATGRISASPRPLRKRMPFAVPRRRASARPTADLPLQDRLRRPIHLPAALEWLPAAALFALILAVLAIATGEGAMRGSGSRSAPASAVSRIQQSTPVFEGSQQAYVTAARLDCRTAPGEESRSARIIGRGEPVRIIGVEPVWASIAHEGRQCWAPARYLAPDRPL